MSNLGKKGRTYSPRKNERHLWGLIGVRDVELRESGGLREEEDEVGEEVFREKVANGPPRVWEHGSYLFQGKPRERKERALSQDVISRVGCPTPIQC